MHTWGDIYAGPAIDWAAPSGPIGYDNFGAVYQLATSSAEGAFPFIFHKGDIKSVDEDQSWELSNGMEVWVTMGSAE
eukprot:gene10041-16119_t